MTFLSVHSKKQATTLDSFVNHLSQTIRENSPDIHWDKFFGENTTTTDRVAVNILAQLDAPSLARCGCVCKLWRKVTDYKDFWQRFAFKTVFDQHKWEYYFGSPGEVPPFTRSMYINLKEPCPVWKGKKVEDTHKLVLMVKQINEKPLSIMSLHKMSMSPRAGNSIHLYAQIKAGNLELFNGGRAFEFAEIALTESYWALISKQSVPGSQDLCKISRSEDNKRGEQLEALFFSRYPGYRKGKAIEFVTLALTHYVETGERLFSGSKVPDFNAALASFASFKKIEESQESKAHTGCIERTDTGYSLMVGPFYPPVEQKDWSEGGLRLIVGEASSIAIVKELKPSSSLFNSLASIENIKEREIEFLRGKIKEKDEQITRLSNFSQSQKIVIQKLKRQLKREK